MLKTQTFVIGDTHGRLFPESINGIAEYCDENNILLEESSVIILGDSGFNYYSDEKARLMKECYNKIGCYFYMVRGNHEARPEDVKGMELVFDEVVNNYVYMELQYPNLRYLLDGEVYKFGNFEKCLVIGGAYSIDKEYRILNNWKWFENEELNLDEQEEILYKIENKEFDVVLTHDAPFDIKPVQGAGSLTEHFLNWVKDNIKFEKWFYGHFHMNTLQDNFIGLDAERSFYLFDEAVTIKHPIRYEGDTDGQKSLRFYRTSEDS